MKTALKIGVYVAKLAWILLVNVVIPILIGLVFGVYGLCAVLFVELLHTKRQNKLQGRVSITVTYKGKRLENRALCFANADKTQGYIRYGKKHIAVKHTRLGWRVK